PAIPVSATRSAGILSITSAHSKNNEDFMTTTTLVLAYSQQDAALAGRLEKDLRDKGWVVKSELSPNTRDVLIALISPNANADGMMQAAIIQALDSAQRIIPVQVAPAPLPALISHLPALDFTSGYPLSTLLERINAATAPDARLPLKVLTPSVR